VVEPIQASAGDEGKVTRDLRAEVGMTLGIVKRTEEEFADWLGTEWGFAEGLLSYDDEPIALEQYQLNFLQNRSRFRWVTKSRQVGFSFLFALEALARCHLREKHTAVFVSYNLDDAKEKILVARQVHEELPLAYQKRLVVDSKTELAFESNGATKRLSRILSHPSKAPRGKKGDVYLDELAHYVNDREVYRGSTALILRSNGQLTGCSTPLGRRGIFWEIANEELRKYPHHTRQGAEGVPETAPPRVLFIWPEVVTVECVVASVEFTYKQLAVDGTVLVYAASVTFEEILDTRVTSEELREAEL
jgi:hypothetical protein